MKLKIEVCTDKFCLCKILKHFFSVGNITLLSYFDELPEPRLFLRNWNSYRYDGQNQTASTLISDGGLDMYDSGNRVNFFMSYFC